MSDSPSVTRSLLSKLLFIVGVLVLLGLLAWGILKFVPKVVSGVAGVGGAISNLFGTNSLDVAVSPDTVKSDTPANISWVYSKADDGVYSLSYDCKSGATLTLEREGSAKKTMACGTGYSLGDEAGFATITPKLLAGSSLADVDLRIAYRQDGNDLAVGTELLTVTGDANYDSPDDGDSAASEATVTSNDIVQSGNGYSISWSGSGAGSSNTTTGKPNLSISNPMINDETLTFDVQNTGGGSTGVWDFAYNTPTSPSDTFNGPAMISLKSGEAMRVRVRFSEVDSGSHNVQIRIDPFNRISETNENDNVLLMTVRGSGSSNNNSNNDDANLRLYNLEVGRIDSDGDFEEDDQISENDDLAVRFKVQNDGDDDTGSWRYEIEISGEDDYRSSTQSSLDPGDSKTITVTLGEMDSDDYEITVTVDSDDDVDEEDEDDNEDSEEIEVD